MGWKAPVDCNGRRCFPFLPFMASENSGRERAGERTPLKNEQAACSYGLLCFPGGLFSVPLFVTTPFRFENRQGPPQFLRRAPVCRETPGVDKGPQPPAFPGFSADCGGLRFFERRGETSCTVGADCRPAVKAPIHRRFSAPAHMPPGRPPQGIAAARRRRDSLRRSCGASPGRFRAMLPSFCSRSEFFPA